MSLHQRLEEAACGHGAPEEDRAQVDARAGAGAATYGESPLHEAARIFAWLRLGAHDEFVDLGSGTGKLVALAALTTPVGRARGIELSPFRHQAAQASHARLRAEFPRADWARVELIEGDLREADVSRASVLYAGATAFPPPLLEDLVELAARAPRLRALVVTRPLPSPAPLVERARVRVSTSWAADAWVVVYEPRRCAAGLLP